MRKGTAPQELRTPLRVYRLAWCATLVFGIWYAALSFGNHYYFRTFAFDLGIKNQAVFDYAHGRHNYNTVLPELGGEVNNLANHFEPILALASPLYWVFGNWTLLIVQWFCLLLGAWGMFRFARCVAPQKDWLPLAAMLSFFMFWGVFSTLSFDVHTNAMAAGFLPWLFVAFQQKKWRTAAFWALLMVACKENIALWLAFIGLGLAWHYRNQVAQRKAALVLSLASVFAFLLILKWVMPYMANGKLEYLHFNYRALGEDMGQALSTLITQPWKGIELLFFVPEGTESSFALKAKTWTWELLLMSGAWIALLRPSVALMSLPILAQKMFNDDPIKWSPFLHYNIEFAPILGFALVIFVARVNPKMYLVVVSLVLLGGAAATWRSFDLYRPQAYMPQQLKVWHPEHWRRSPSPVEIRQILTNIPSEASVCASSVLVPHLANRRVIRTWPDVKEDDYVVLFNDGQMYYPQDQASFIESVENLKLNQAYTLLQNKDGIIVFMRIPKFGKPRFNK
jgi:uncharacterized membrane protein